MLTIWELVGLSGTTVLGSLLHFFYEWTGKSAAVAWLAAIDESVWEHMKLLVWPWMLFSSIMAIVYRKTDQDVWLSRALGLLAALGSMPLLFYFYTHNYTRENVMWLDILLFLFSIIFGTLVSIYVRHLSPTRASLKTFIGLGLHLSMLLAFTGFSYVKPVAEDDSGFFHEKPKWANIKT